MKFKTPYTNCYRVQLKCDDQSLTDQSFLDECDIQFIIENFVRTGKIPDSTMSYVDCTTVDEFQNAQYLVAECKSNFENLPSPIRDEFKTVENYLAYVSNPKNLKDSYERGLIDKSTVDLSDVYPDKAGSQPVPNDKESVTKEESVSANG